MAVHLAALAGMTTPQLPPEPAFDVYTNPYKAKHSWPPDFSKLSDKHQFRLERRYKRRAKLKWARPGLMVATRLAQWGGGLGMHWHSAAEIIQRAADNLLQGSFSTECYSWTGVRVTSTLLKVFAIGIAKRQARYGHSRVVLNCKNQIKAANRSSYQNISAPIPRGGLRRLSSTCSLSPPATTNDLNLHPEFLAIKAVADR